MLQGPPTSPGAFAFGRSRGKPRPWQPRRCVRIPYSWNLCTFDRKRLIHVMIFMDREGPEIPRVGIPDSSRLVFLGCGIAWH